MSKYFNPRTDPKLYSCPCGCGKQGPDGSLLIMLDAMRQLYGRPIIVTSGPRCEDYNAKVGGVLDSAHTRAKAADLACTNSRDRLALVHSAIECGCKRIGVAKTFVHVDVDEDLPEGLWTY